MICHYLDSVFDITVILFVILFGNMIYLYLVRSIVKIAVTDQTMSMTDMKLKEFVCTKQDIKRIEKTLNSDRINLSDCKKLHTYIGAQKPTVEVNGMIYKGDLQIIL